jgi:hypothetical protein
MQAAIDVEDCGTQEKHNGILWGGGEGCCCCMDGCLLVCVEHVEAPQACRQQQIRTCSIDWCGHALAAGVEDVAQQCARMQQELKRGDIDAVTQRQQEVRRHGVNWCGHPLEPESRGYMNRVTRRQQEVRMRTREQRVGCAHLCGSASNWCGCCETESAAAHEHISR